MRLPPTPAEVSSLRRRLLDHYDTNRRDLPWRRTSDPYRILVAEIMLQQTTVAAVVPFYRRWVRRFPSLACLAAASEEDVLSLWSGLGYYNRARNLHRACREVVGRHQGRLPSCCEELLELPGIGPYTAGAVASIAFGRPEPVLDGNVKRVLSRLTATRENRAQTWKTLTAAARLLVAGPRPGDLNQALMELGATVCTPRRPRCSACPVSRSCRARKSGEPEEFPAPARRTRLEGRRGMALLLRSKGGILLVRRPPGPLMPGLWELPGVTGFDADSPEPRPSVVASRAARQLGTEVLIGPRLAEIRHTVLNRRVVLEVRQGSLRGASPGRRQAPGTAADGAREVMRFRPSGQAPPALTAASRKALVASGVLPAVGSL